VEALALTIVNLRAICDIARSPTSQQALCQKMPGHRLRRLLSATLVA
jgi:hypothetical protein